MKKWAWLCLGAWLLVGCSDQDAGKGDGAGSPDLSEQLDMEPLDQGHEPDAEADTPQEDASQDTSPDASPEDMGAPTVCAPGELSCSEDGLTQLYCRSNGQWAEQPCPEGYSCQAPGECFPDANICREGQRICLTDEQPALCDPGVAWSPQAPCPQGQACLEGVCRSQRCADAARISSYLGCDYIAVDMPNLAYSNLGGTEDAPIGVVLANASQEEPVTFSVFNPGGGAAVVVGERTVEPSDLANPLNMYEPVTVRSEIRTASGRVANAAFTQAQDLEIPPGGLAVVLLDHHGYIETTRVGPQTWYIQTSQPVAAYQFSPYCCNYSFTNDASLLFPVSTFGTEYYGLGVPAWGDIQPDPSDGVSPPERVGSGTYMTVVSAQDNTRVTVELPAGVEMTSDGAGRVTYQSNQATVTLNKHEVAHLVTQRPAWRNDRPPLGSDLSGARVTANHPIGVFSGHLCTFYPQLEGACDHLEEQLFPVDTWGQDFILAPPRTRNEGANSREAVYWKMLARDADTRVELTVPFAQLNPLPPGFAGVPDCADHLEGERTLVLGQGEYCEFGTRSPVQARANGPMMVMGIISGQSSTGVFNAFGAHAGDPAIFLVPPRAQYRSEYAFLTPTTYYADYLTIVTSPQASVELDGEQIEMSDATDVPGANLVYKHILLEQDGPHQINSNFPLGILVYAYDDYVSYAYTGGLNLIKRQ